MMLERDRERLLQWFGTDHLPDHLKGLVESYRTMAEQVIANTEASPEQTIAIRFLEQSKDYAVRALILKQ